jgi:GxxExxY protein
MMDTIVRDRLNAIGTEIVRSAIKVHRLFGPGLLESAYQSCLSWELRNKGLRVEAEVNQPIEYQGHRLEVGYRIDMLVDGLVIIENKSLDRLLPIHTAQILTYLELSGNRLGYLLNWNVTLMKNGIHRYVVGSYSKERRKSRRSDSNP